MNKESIVTGEDFYEKKKTLKLIKQLNWENYYVDESTNEKWVEEYPNGAMQGGGPPQLRLIDKFPWDADEGNISN